MKKTRKKKSKPDDSKPGGGKSVVRMGRQPPPRFKLTAGCLAELNKLTDEAFSTTTIHRLEDACKMLMIRSSLQDARPEVTKQILKRWLKATCALDAELNAPLRKIAADPAHEMGLAPEMAAAKFEFIEAQQRSPALKMSTDFEGFIADVETVGQILERALDTHTASISRGAPTKSDVSAWLRDVIETLDHAGLELTFGSRDKTSPIVTKIIGLLRAEVTRMAAGVGFPAEMRLVELTRKAIKAHRASS